jgi:hypothetical protein
MSIALIGGALLRSLCVAATVSAAMAPVLAHAQAPGEEPITVEPMEPPPEEAAPPQPPPENGPDAGQMPQDPPAAEPSFEESLQRLLEEGRAREGKEREGERGVESLPPPSIARTGATLRGLDKITARVRTFDAPLDQPVDFGRLTITLRACKERPPEEPPESAAFLEIDETPPGQETRRVFSGWMLASSPGLSALEHPAYDVWVLHCTTVSPDASAASE